MSAKNCEATTSFSDSHNDSTVTNYEDSPESLDQRNTFRGTKIAKRARSFKEDFFEKISQMRTPTNTISRSHSPKTKNTQIRDDSSKSTYDINYHAKQVRHSLTHFKDVIAKNKLEMLSGNGTIVLETIANVHSALKAQKLNNTHNSAIISATQQVHHSLGSLIKLCDDALISENEEDFIALNKETVKEIVTTLDLAVTNLVNLANEKADASSSAKKNAENDVEQQHDQRSSLPDIPLSKKEKAELEKSMLIQNSHSSESILHDLKPPPKPSKIKKEAPPLPPKRKTASIDELPDDPDFSTMQVQVPSQSDFNQFSFARSIDFYNDFDDNEAFSSPEKFLFRSRTLNESSAKVMKASHVQRQSNEFSSIQMKECQIKIDTEIDSEMHQTDNNFSFMSLTNQSSSKLKLMTERNIISNENLYLLDPASEEKPPLPVKTRSRSLRLEHHKSMYDNVDDANRNSLDTKASTTSSTSSLTSTLSQTSARTTENISDFHQSVSVKNKYMSCIETGSSFGIDENPPPLPLKKKHIMAYMEIFGNASHHTHQVSSNDDVTMMRHSVHSFSQSAKIQSHSVGIQSNLTPKKPALPPKQKLKINSSNASLNNIITPPVSPKISNDSVFSNSQNELVEKENSNLNQENEEKINNCDNKEPETVVLRRKPTEILKPLMEELDLQDHLIFKKDVDDLALIGGQIDALIIYATKNSAQRISELQILRGAQSIAFGEAFLLTFRTFIDPYDLVDKLIYRYNFFSRQNNDLKQKTAKESFSLLVRVVNDVTCPDLSTKLMEKLIQFVYDLVCAGELLMAKLLRVKVIEKAHLLKQKNLIGPNMNLPCSRPIWSNPPNLLDLKSTEIAEQLTLLDSELFLKIEIPEILIWAEQQCEEKSPNLTQFTAHFNKLSYWARTQILKQQDARDREKHVMKFIKIMKHLRKINNFNSYLALLSALDSAPIRRLEWRLNITEGLKEYCALIDSSSSFRAYRQALSETSAPCIPYIGLVLQDLTFVHIGNPDYLEDGSINFSKRWQQSSLILNMKRFRNSSYTFKKNDRITSALNFDEFFDEETMWQISEKIKPRGKKVLTN